MAFNAGSIEATLTLNRNPFTAGLAAARSQARSFANERYTATAAIRVDRQSLDNAIRQLRQFGANSRQALARVLVDRDAFDRLLRDLREFAGRTYTARARVDVDGLADLIRLRAELAGLRDRTVNVRARGTESFGAMHGQMRAILALLPLLVLAIAPAIEAAVALGGALVSAFGIAGAAGAAFGGVAISIFKQITDGAKLSHEQIAKLPDGIRQASLQMHILNETWEKLVQRTQGGVGNALAEWFHAAYHAVRTLDPAINAVSRAISSAGKEAQAYFDGPAWRSFVQFLGRTAEPMIGRFWDIIKLLTQSVMNLIVAFEPLAAWLLDKIIVKLEQFADWTGKLAGSRDFQKWLEQAKVSIEGVFTFIGALIRFLWELSTTLAPVGTVVLNFFSNLLDALGALDPAVLSGITMGILGLVAAMSLGVTGPAGLLIGVLTGTATALSVLYDSNERVRQTIDGMVNELRTTFLPIWDQASRLFQQYVVPAWNSLVDTYRTSLEPVLRDLWQFAKDKIIPALESLVDTVVRKMIPAFLEFLSAAQPVVEWFVHEFGEGLVLVIEAVVRAFDGGFTMITGLLQTFTGLFRGDWEQFWNGLRTIAEGFWTVVASLFGMSFEDLRAQFQEWDRLMRNDWNEFWGGIITDQNGHQTTVNGSWNDFWNATAQNFQDQLVIPVSNAWVDFWGGVRTEQDGSQTQVGGAWNEFWAATARNFQDQLVTPVSNAWVDFWGGVRTEQDGSQTVVGGSWNQFWSDTATNFRTQLVEPVSQWWTQFWDDTQATNERNSEILSTAWNGMLNGLHDTAVTVWGRIETFWDTTMTSIRTITDGAVEGLRIAWRAIGNFFREPINWVINVVINDGILGAWNTVMGWIGAPGLQAGRVPSLPAFADGGRIVGKGTATSDSILARVSNGEFVVREQIASKASHFLAALNSGQTEALQAAGVFRGGSPYPQYAAGGPVEAGLAFARSQVGKPYVWGGVGPGGYDCSGFMSAITNVLRGRAPHSRVGSTANFPWAGFHSGLDTAFGIGSVGSVNGGAGHMAGTLGGTNVESSSGPGVRVGNGRGALDGLFSTRASLGEVGGFFTGGESDLIEMIVSWWSQISGKVTDLFNGIPKLIPGIGGPIGDGIQSLPGALIGKAFDAIKTKLENMFTTITVQGNASAAAGANLDVQAQVDAVAKQYGWGIGSPQWSALSMLINKESSWNPNAKNPTSSAAGLFQKMTSLHGAVEPTVAGQTQWGLNYIKSTYGTPAAAWAFHQSHGWYDNGGILPPILPYNGTGQPEAVLTKPQWDGVMNGQTNEDILRKLDRLIEVMENNAGSTNVYQYGMQDPAENARRTLLSIRMAKS